jgi:hypothetical protein
MWKHRTHSAPCLSVLSCKRWRFGLASRVMVPEREESAAGVKASQRSHHHETGTTSQENRSPRLHDAFNTVYCRTCRFAAPPRPLRTLQVPCRYANTQAYLIQRGCRSGLRELLPQHACVLGHAVAFLHQMHRRGQHVHGPVLRMAQRGGEAHCSAQLRPSQAIMPPNEMFTGSRPFAHGTANLPAFVQQKENHE